MLQKLKTLSIKRPSGTNKKRKFILSVGDEGAVLIHMAGNTLLKRLFLTSPSSPELQNLVSKEPKTPIYILADVIDQAYIQHALPPVSALNINKLVNRRLKKDFSHEDITAAVSMGREKTGRRDWNYLFIAVKNMSPFSDWIDEIAELENELKGIYLLPIEAEPFLKRLQKHFPPKKDTPAEWQIIVVHNRVGGFRQIVFKENRTFFTRISQPIGGMAPEVIAGNIEQETLNTIEYIRRLGYTDESGLTIYGIGSEEVKQSLESSVLSDNDFTFLTPLEISEKLSLKGAAQTSDRFGDVVLSAFFANRNKPKLRLHTPYTKKLFQLALGRLGVKIAAGTALIGMALAAVFLGINIYQLQDEIALSKKDKTRAEQMLNEAEKATEDFAGNPTVIKDVAKLYTHFTEHEMQILNFIDNYGSIRGFNIRVKDIQVDLEEKENPPHKLKANIRTQFMGADTTSLDRMLEDLSLFKEDLRRKFREYKIEFSGLPDEKEFEIFDSTKEGRKVFMNILIVGPLVGGK